MLRLVKKQFEADHGVILKPGDIVDDSAWKHSVKLMSEGYLTETAETKATVSLDQPVKSTAPASTPQVRKNKVKRSALSGRPKVFMRKP